MYQAKVAQYKKDKVVELSKLFDEFPIVGIVNIENIPSPQLARMRQQLRGKVNLIVSKKPFIERAIAASTKKDIKNLQKHVIGMPALLFTKENPFKLASIMRKSRTAAPAKPGQLAPRDIVIPAGPTQFAPGPIISELGAVGLKTGVEGGKVSIRSDHTIVHENEKISQKVSEVLTKLGIQPMEIGLDLVAIYEDGIIYERSVLSVDEKQYLDNVRLAALEAQNLAVFAGYATKDTIKLLVAKAFTQAKGLAISKELVSDVLLQKWITDAERAARAINEQIPAGAQQ
jgi:large subunit ribosomal protein L10